MRGAPYDTALSCLHQAIPKPTLAADTAILYTLEGGKESALYVKLTSITRDCSPWWDEYCNGYKPDIESYSWSFRAASSLVNPGGLFPQGW